MINGLHAPPKSASFSVLPESVSMEQAHAVDASPKDHTSEQEPQRYCPSGVNIKVWGFGWALLYSASIMR